MVFNTKGFHFNSIDRTFLEDVIRGFGNIDYFGESHSYIITFILYSLYTILFFKTYLYV